MGRDMRMGKKSDIGMWKGTMKDWLLQVTGSAGCFWAWETWNRSSSLVFTWPSLRWLLLLTVPFCVETNLEEIFIPFFFLSSGILSSFFIQFFIQFFYPIFYPILSSGIDPGSAELTSCLVLHSPSPSYWFQSLTLWHFPLLLCFVLPS